MQPPKKYLIGIEDKKKIFFLLVFCFAFLMVSASAQARWVCSTGGGTCIEDPGDVGADLCDPAKNTGFAGAAAPANADCWHQECNSSNQCVWAAGWPYKQNLCQGVCQHLGCNSLGQCRIFNNYGQTGVPDTCSAYSVDKSVECQHMGCTSDGRCILITNQKDDVFFGEVFANQTDDCSTDSDCKHWACQSGQCKLVSNNGTASLPPTCDANSEANPCKHTVCTSNGKCGWANDDGATDSTHANNQPGCTAAKANAGSDPDYINGKNPCMHNVCNPLTARCMQVAGAGEDECDVTTLLASNECRHPDCGVGKNYCVWWTDRGKNDPAHAWSQYLHCGGNVSEITENVRTQKQLAQCKHNECQLNGQCKQVNGRNISLVGHENDNQCETPTTGPSSECRHPACVSGKCVWQADKGIFDDAHLFTDETAACDNPLEPGTTQTSSDCRHTVCTSDGKCAWANDNGLWDTAHENQCDPADANANRETNQCKHTECQGSRCVIKPGAGPLAPGTGAPCRMDDNPVDTSLPNPLCRHTDCNSSGQCYWAEGPGENKAGCSGVQADINASVPECKQSHNVCTCDGKCVSAKGPGNDECTGTLDCQHFQCNENQQCVPMPGKLPPGATSCASDGDPKKPDSMKCTRQSDTCDIETIKNTLLGMSVSFGDSTIDCGGTTLMPDMSVATALLDTQGCQGSFKIQVSSVLSAQLGTHVLLNNWPMAVSQGFYNDANKCNEWSAPGGCYGDPFSTQYANNPCEFNLQTTGAPNEQKTVTLELATTAGTGINKIWNFATITNVEFVPTYPCAKNSDCQKVASCNGNTIQVFSPGNCIPIYQETNDNLFEQTGGYCQMNLNVAPYTYDCTTNGQTNIGCLDQYQCRNFNGSITSPGAPAYYPSKQVVSATCQEGGCRALQINPATGQSIPGCQNIADIKGCYDSSQDLCSSDPNKPCFCPARCVSNAGNNTSWVRYNPYGKTEPDGKPAGCQNITSDSANKTKCGMGNNCSVVCNLDQKTGLPSFWNTGCAQAYGVVKTVYCTMCADDRSSGYTNPAECKVPPGSKGIPVIDQVCDTGCTPTGRTRCGTPTECGNPIEGKKPGIEAEYLCGGCVDGANGAHCVKNQTQWKTLQCCTGGGFQGSYCVGSSLCTSNLNWTPGCSKKIPWFPYYTCNGPTGIPTCTYSQECADQAAAKSNPDTITQGTKTTHTVCSQNKCVVATGNGKNACKTNADCLKTEHTECKNLSCVAVAGAGGDKCSADSDCAGSYTDCDFGKQKCLASSEPGMACQGDADCSAHTECVDKKCALTAGTGKNVCDDDSGCQDVSGTPKTTHLECNSQNQCAVVQGQGSDSCSADADCLITSHLKCNYGQSACYSEEGPGQNKCSVDANCSVHNSCVDSKCVIAPGAGSSECQNDSGCCGAGHSVCQDGECVCVSGAGTNECTSSTQCKTTDKISASHLEVVMNNCSGIRGAEAVSFRWSYNSSEGSPEYSYHLQISSRMDFSNPEVDRIITNLSNPSGTFNQQTVLARSSVPNAGDDYIAFNRSYAWRVMVFDKDGNNSGWINYNDPQDPDGDGRSYTIQRSGHPSPNPVFVFTPSDPSAGKVVAFNDLSVCYDNQGTAYPCSQNTNCYGGNCYHWDFGDEQSAYTTGNTSHTYAAPASYNATLYVCDQSTCCSTTQSIPVNNGKIPNVPLWQEISPF